MSFDTANDNTREIVAREAGRAHPGGGAFAAPDPEWLGFFRDLYMRGKLHDRNDTPPPEVAA